MRRVAICGGETLRAAARALGLEEDVARAEAVLVDASDDDAVARALALAASVPRVFVADGVRAALLEAGGATHIVAPPPAAGALGPVIHSIERGQKSGLTTLLCCAAVGAAGRTSLVANLALRVARHTPVVAVDATGTGALAWRVGATVAPWADIAVVGAELGEGHLRLAAAECDGVLVIGGTGAADEDLARRVVELARGLGVVLIDAPAHRPPRALTERADRIVVCANPDAASAAATRALLEELADRDPQLLVSQAEERHAREIAALYGRQATFLLPRDEPACRAALAARSLTRGKLGRAYDAIAEILVAEVVR